MNRRQYRLEARHQRNTLRPAEPYKVVAHEDINFQIDDAGRLTAGRCFYEKSAYKGQVVDRVNGVLTLVLLSDSYTKERSKESRRATVAAIRRLRTEPCTIRRVPIPG